MSSSPPSASSASTSEKLEPSSHSSNSTQSTQEVSSSSSKPLFSANSPYAALPVEPGQTKSAIKKAFKKEQWQAGKLERRRKEKERRKANKLAKKLQEKESKPQVDGDLVQDADADAIAEASNEAKDHGSSQNKNNSRRRKVEKNCRIVIDCGFDDLMTDQEITSMSSQLSYLYSVNRTSCHPFKSIIISGSNLIRGGNYSKIKKKVKDPSGNEMEIETGEASKPHESAIKEALQSGSENLERAEIESSGGWNDESNPKPSDFQETVGPDSGLGKNWNPSIFKGRVGKRMELQMKGDWRKWKRVQIVEKGGLESLWETPREEEKDSNQPSDAGVNGNAQGPNTSRKESAEAERDRMEGVEADEGGKQSPKAYQDPSDSVVENSSKGKGKSNSQINNRSQPSWKCTEKFNKEDIVYLTADSDETIEELEDGKVYVLGGIVDRNRHKDLCSNKAKALGLRTARLPLDPKYLFNQTELKTRKVLTVNQVIEILVGYNEEKDWKLAIERGLPTRKLDPNGGKAEKRKRGHGENDDDDGERELREEGRKEREEQEEQQWMEKKEENHHQERGT